MPTIDRRLTTLAFVILGLSKPAIAAERLVYFGTYTGGESRGIYVSTFNPDSGTLSPPTLGAETRNPSFLALRPDGRFLYAVGELNEVEGRPGGAVTAFAIDSSSGRLTRINQQSSRGAGPCHLTVDATGRWVLVANYGGGSVGVLPIREDGSLGEAVSFVQHEGSSVNPQRQKEPHAHSINLDAANRFAFVADLGLDKILVYRFDPATGALQPNAPPSTSIAPGSGPRHFAFHGDHRHGFVINELLSTVTALSYDPGSGTLTKPETISTLPPDFKGESYTAEVCCHPSGKFVYGSNRGHDSIAVFAWDKAAGKLTPVEIESTQGRTPRNFVIDPSGRWLLAANQDSKSVVVFAIDPETGALKPSGHTATVGSPVCIRFLPAL